MLPLPGQKEYGSAEPCRDVQAAWNDRFARPIA